MADGKEDNKVTSKSILKLQKKMKEWNLNISAAFERN